MLQGAKRQRQSVDATGVTCEASKISPNTPIHRTCLCGSEVWLQFAANFAPVFVITCPLSRLSMLKDSNPDGYDPNERALHNSSRGPDCCQLVLPLLTFESRSSSVVCPPFVLLDAYRSHTRTLDWTMLQPTVAPPVFEQLTQQCGPAYGLIVACRCPHASALTTRPIQAIKPARCQAGRVRSATDAMHMSRTNRTR